MSKQVGLTFSLNAEGALEVVLADGSRHAPVCCNPLFPLSSPDTYIAIVHVAPSGVRTHIETVKSLSDLEPPQQMLVKKDIRYRYFIPEIIEIQKITSLRRVDTWVVKTDRGKISFTVRNRQENMIRTAQGGLLVIDEHQRRYKISRREHLSRRSQQELQRLI